MSDTVIRAESLGKKYVIGHETERHRYATLGDVGVAAARNLWQRTRDTARGRAIVVGDTIEEFWALKDVNFEVKRGEVLGIIGRNGAGKSTLLKILSRITEPSEGRVEIRGRVASLLEVGTGFHPELSGRENIFLNGAILGMTRAEIRRTFDEIVDFSGVEKFIDTPVKRYSSGMYVRLAFAIAAHLQPEILVIDEVLAVGDAEFQKKCLGKMHDLSSRLNRTVLLVSHNLGVVTQLASNAIVLNGGCLAFYGDVPAAVSTLLGGGSALNTLYQATQRPDSNAPHVATARIATLEVDGVHCFGDPLQVTFVIKHPAGLARPHFSFQIVNQFEQPILHAWALYPEPRFGLGTESTLVCRFPDLRLNVGRYFIRTHLTEPPGGEVYERLDRICEFQVIRTDGMPWGWHPEFCAYHPRWEWTINGQVHADTQQDILG